MIHFVYAHWLAGYPIGTRCRSIRLEETAVPTAASLHKLLGDRREAFRPDETTDSLTRIECLLNSIRG